MEIRAEEISDIIKGQIQDYDKKVDVSETGTILSVGDGIARVYGVEKAMAMEMLEFPGGIFGLCLNLEEDNVGIAIMVHPFHVRCGVFGSEGNDGCDCLLPLRQILRWRR